MIENAIDNEFLAGIHTNKHGFGIRTTKILLLGYTKHTVSSLQRI